MSHSDESHYSQNELNPPLIYLCLSYVPLPVGQLSKYYYLSPSDLSYCLFSECIGNLLDPVNHIPALIPGRISYIRTLFLLGSCYCPCLDKFITGQDLLPYFCVFLLYLQIGQERKKAHVNLLKQRKKKLKQGQKSTK